jgi:hypothetical protein
MFGMTKKQFLKKTKKALEETGSSILQLMDIIEKEKNNKISEEDALKKLELVRKDIEKVFNEYETIKPPSKCFPIFRKLLNNLVLLQETVNINQEYLMDTDPSQKEYNFSKSVQNFEDYRSDFNDLRNSVYVQFKKY